MRKALLLVFLLGQLPALATQIVVGLRSDNIISWGVWEREGTSLKHYLLLYNNSSQPLSLVIREWDSQAVSPVPGKSKKLYQSQLLAKQLVRLRYPKTRAKVGYLEYFENAVSVGVLPSNLSRPDAAALSGETYRYYTNEGSNSHSLTYWLAFNSLVTPPAQLRLTAATAFPTFTPHRRGEEAYCLVKLYPSYAAAPRQPGALDSLLAAGPDPTIGRLDSARQAVVVPASFRFLPMPLPVLVVLIETVEHSFRYNEQRQLVPDKSVSGVRCLLPFFPPLPN
ncbi:MAG: hypothetical protein EOO56_22545 [Hymenobacter sp.]|nr:MAG: hypothetical protein EOO56_22545 [Hymenobacter sp.]